jgi:VIT1/CCC1 family predicted Fe2+/Mn2+ transporter
MGDIRNRHTELHGKGIAPLLSEFILGWQDGLVNVLGLILGVAAATGDPRIVIVAGLAGTFAESISMAAVAYTSNKAEHDYYKKELAREKWEMKNWPDKERQEIRVIYRRKGFTGPLLEAIVQKITGNKKRWLNAMMEEELKLTPPRISPSLDAILVGISAIVGSLIPLTPFFFMSVNTGIITALVVSALALFFVGAIKAKATIGDWRSSGIEMFIIGMLAAIVGYTIGAVFGVVSA